MVELTGIEPVTPCLQSRLSQLSQLSYSPRLDMVGLGGFEPPTSPLSGVRSNHLSYRPELGFGIKQCVWALKRAKGHY
jgi:hypothetical protein